MADRYDALRPNHIAASIASMPRRWKDTFKIAPNLNIEDLFQLAGTDGHTLAEHCGAALTQLDLLLNAIRRTCYATPEPLADGVLAAVSNSGSGPWPNSARDALNALTTVFAELDEQLGALNTNDWNRSASAGSTNFTVLQLAQATARVSADRLLAVEALLRQLT